MGSVHLALDLTTRTECALKRLHARNVGGAHDTLRREFELLARVRHPSVVRVFELGFAPDGTPYYTMEYLPGLPADQALRRGDWRALCFAGVEVALGLEALHSANVLHGDLKPSNLLVIPGQDADALPTGVRILDFGLAALLDRQREGHRGTPGFAAPEVVRGDMPVVASDLYSLGATLFALAAGRVSFASPSRTTSAALRGSRTVRPSAVALDEAGVPARLAQLVLRLMAPSIGERPSSAQEVREELERIEPSARRSLSRRLRTEIVTGRERELARLERWLARAPEGAVVTLIHGEPGAGKSALLGELSVRASLAGRRVVRLSCASFTAPGELARVLWRRLAVEADAEQDGSTRSRRALEILERGHDALEEAEIALLAEAACAWGKRLLERGTLVVLMLDDRERIDPVSRVLVRRTIFRPGASALRWVWTGRSAGSEMVEDDRVLLESGQAERLELAALDGPAVERLVSMRLHAHVPRDLLYFLLERGAGLPGLLVELLRTAAERGAFVETVGGLRVNPEALSRVELPAGFESSLMERLQKVSPRARAAVEVLAVFGRPLSRDALDALEPGASNMVAGELDAAGLVAADAMTGFALSTPALAPLVTERIERERRRHLHRLAIDVGGLSDVERFVHLRGAGEAVAALDAADAAFSASPSVSLALDAARLAEGEVVERAMGWLIRAAELLVLQGRHAAAVPPLERALHLGENQTPAFEAWGLLSTAYIRAGRLEEVDRLLERARTTPMAAVDRSLILTNASAHASWTGDHARGIQLAVEALDLARTTSNAAAIGSAAMSLSGLCMMQGEIDRAVDLVRESEETGLRLGDDTVRARAIGQRANIELMRGEFERAVTSYQSALEIARKAGRRFAIEELLGNLGIGQILAGRWAEAADSCEEALRLALEDGRPIGVAQATVNLSLLDGLLGRPVKALRRARASIRLTQTWQMGREPLAWRGLAQAHRISGRLRHAEQALARGLELAERLGQHREADWCRIEYLRTRVMTSRWREAKEAVDRSLDQRASEDVIAHVLMLAYSGRAALRLSDTSGARARLEQCEKALSGRTAPYAEAHTTQLRAEIALIDQESVLGLELARETLEAFSRLPAPVERACAALDFARLCMKLEGEAVALVSEWLQEAASGFERLGDHPSRERALALTVEWLQGTRQSAPTAAQERDLLQSVGRLLDSLSNLQTFERRAMRMAVEHLGAERGVLLLAESKTGEMVSVVEHGAVDAATRNQAVSYSHRVVERVTRSGGSLLIGDAPTHPDVLSESVVGLGLRSILCVPLHVGGNVVGAVYVDDSRRPDAFTRDDRGLLEGFAHLMVTAIENSRGHEEVRRANEQLVGENLSLRREARVRFQPQNFIGASLAMQEVLAVVERAAQTATTVLITGENGTGKELIARILHHSGRRSQGPFVGLNCGAIPETLLESELFGILPNVATGVRGRDGRFLQANGGTLFLDEIGEMPPSQQVALLSAIANREITPVGGRDPISVDVRIIAATNKDLRRSLEEGSFREDLYYRLNVIPIEIPPLRDRKADIPAMAHHFAAKLARQLERDVPELSAEFMAALMQSDWPGNVRELQNYVERVMAMTTGRVLNPVPLPRDLETRGKRLRISRGKRLQEVVGEIERKLIREALDRSGGNQSGAARELGLTEQSLRYRLRKFQSDDTRAFRRVRKKRR